MPKFKYARVLLIALVLMLVLSACTVEYDTDQSFLDSLEHSPGITAYTEEIEISGYRIVEWHHPNLDSMAKVYFEIYVTLISTYPEDQFVRLYAVSPEDAKGGWFRSPLLGSPIMEVYYYFPVPANGSISKVFTFEGSHGGGRPSQNRPMPQIIVIDTESDYE